MVFQTHKALDEAGDKIDAADKANVEADLKALKDLVDNSDPNNMTEQQVADIKAAQEKLMTGAQSLFQKMYEQAGGAAGAAGAGPDMGNAGSQQTSGGQDDDIVDGDYKEV